LVDARFGFWVADQRLFYTASGEAVRERSPGGLPQTSLVAGVGTRWESLSGGTVRAAVGTGSQDVLSGFFTQRPSIAVSYDQALIRGAGLASSTYERIRGARTALVSQELSFYDDHQDLAQRVIEDYAVVLLAQGEVDIAQRSVERAQKFYDQNYAKFSGEGLKQPGEQWVSQVAEIDVDQARLSWESSKQQLISRQQATRDAIDRLLLEMGFLPGATPQLTTTIAYAPQEYEEPALIEKAIANSTDLGRLALSQQDAEAALRIARSEDRPDLIASVSVTDLGETLGRQTVSTGWFGGVRVEAPLLDRRREEEVARAQRELEVLQQRIVATCDQVTQEVLRQVRAAASSRARIDIGEQSVALAQKSREAAQGMFEEGLTDYLRVIDADNRLVEAESSLLREQVGYFLTAIRIRRALGEDITQELPE
jgi:outer membrane protein TolC